MVYNIYNIGFITLCDIVLAVSKTLTNKCDYKCVLRGREINELCLKDHMGSNAYNEKYISNHHEE